MDSHAAHGVARGLRRRDSRAVSRKRESSGWRVAARAPGGTGGGAPSARGGGIGRRPGAGPTVQPAAPDLRPAVVMACSRTEIILLMTAIAAVAAPFGRDLHEAL